MDAGISYEPESSIHTVQVDHDPKPRHPNTTTMSTWLNHSENQREERSKSMRGMIHRVPHHLLQAKLNSSRDYQPKAVSLGPYHFGRDDLRKFQELKRSMADRLVPDKELEASLRSEIKKNIARLMDAYSFHELHIFPREWEEMFFLDGCFVLHFIFCIMFNRIEDLKIEKTEIHAVHSDLFLAENQLPFVLLEILSGNDGNLLYMVDDYIYTHKISKHVDWDRRQDEPAHLLDRLRTLIMGGRRDTNRMPQAISQSKPSPRTMLGNAKELTASGIRFKPNRTGFLTDILFRSHIVYGTLTLPTISVNDSTRPLFLNLAAYEMCAGLDSTISSYVCFLDSLVNHADDIEELQSAGVLINHLATDEEAAELLIDMSRGLRPDSDTYIDVKREIQKFGDRLHGTSDSFAFCAAQTFNTHFKTPFTIITFLAGWLGIIFSFVQGYFTIFPRCDK